jgi:uncharacterized protein YdhG (YjbR/CyaY superfamily)
MGVVGDYLKGLPADQREALQKMCDVIVDAAPPLSEKTYYGVPNYFLGDDPLVAFVAAKNHLSLFPHGSQIIREMSDQLEPFSTSKGTIRFTPDEPLPDELVRKIVARRIEILAEG